MSMSYVVAVDIGIKNLGLCAYDFCTNQVIHWENASLVPKGGRYYPACNVQYVREFLARYEQLFQNAAVVIVERQMRCNMRIIESLIQWHYYHRAIVINARSVKLHYGISTRNYKQNKARAIEWVQHFVTANPTAFAGETIKAFQGNKRDDLADALLMTLYYLDTYSNQVNNPN
jgi:hypothetical protein